MIVPSRNFRNKDGDNAIDGGKLRYGIAELWVDVPGEASERSVNRKMKITKAWSFIEKDSVNGRLTKCKLLGKLMYNAPDSDVAEYLYERAEKNPDEVIELYTSSDMGLKLLLIDAKEKGIIIKKDGMYVYADTILGATDDAVMIMFKNPSFIKILDQIKYETYPEYAPVKKIEEVLSEPEIPAPAKKTNKK